MAFLLGPGKKATRGKNFRSDGAELQWQVQCYSPRLCRLDPQQPPCYRCKITMGVFYAQCAEPRCGGGLRNMGLTKIVVRGARQHNLKNISLEIPRNTLTVITGLSGSGKSSLAFDTIYAEGQRRYVESLSAYARQFLDQMERPEVDSIEGLSPAIAIEQKTTTRSPRSTVGTITEIYDYLRVVYSSIGTPHCPNCGRPITRQSTDQIVHAILQRRTRQDRRPHHDPRAHRARAQRRVPPGTGEARARRASSARASTAICTRSTTRRAWTSARITRSKSSWIACW